MVVKALDDCSWCLQRLPVDLACSAEAEAEAEAEDGEDDGCVMQDEIGAWPDRWPYHSVMVTLAKSSVSW